MQIKEAVTSDLEDVLLLYAHLSVSNPMPDLTPAIRELWASILYDKNHHIFIGTLNNVCVCSCIMVIVPNLTHNQRPYALIENVVTHRDYRKNGYATKLLYYAIECACFCNCYKIMLMTGSKDPGVLKF